MFLLIGSLIVVVIIIEIITRIKNRAADKKAEGYFRPPAGVVGAQEKESNMLGEQREKIFEAAFIKRSRSVWRDNDRFLECVNQWLADNPNIYNVKFVAETKKIRGVFTKKEKIERIIIKYDLGEKMHAYQYALVEMQKHSYSRHLPEAKESIEKWLGNNPRAKIVQTNGGIIHTTVSSNYQNGNYMGQSFAHTMQILFLVAIDRETIEYDQPYAQKYIDRKKKKAMIWTSILVVFLGIAIAGKLYLTTKPRMVGAVTYEGLQLSVDQRLPKLIKVDYKNAENEWAFGWVNRSKVTAKTDKGTYYSIGLVGTFRPMREIGAGRSGFFFVYFPNLTGNLESITFETVWHLDARGLPDHSEIANSDDGNTIILPVDIEQDDANIKTERKNIAEADNVLAKAIHNFVSRKEVELLEEIPADLQTYSELIVENVSESSSINEKFSAYAAVDGDSMTSWQEGIKGSDGIGEWLELLFDRTYYVKYMMLQLGNWKSQDSFGANNRPKSLSLQLGDKEIPVQFDDKKKEFWIELCEPINTKQVRLIIDSVFAGSKYKDTCIAEIKLYGY